jgi:hydrocephalus-inducing protein
MVRNSKAQKIQLKNPSAKPWKIKAIISSSSDKNYFQGKEFVEVPANATADYEVIYNPLTMTASPDQPEIK